MTDLNSKQTVGLSNFFFDIAKGLFLAGIGSFTVSDWFFATIFTSVNIYLAYGCVSIALTILKRK